MILLFIRSIYDLYRMFVLTEFTDDVKVMPSAYGEKLQEAITDALNSKYSNKVVGSVGLCIVLYDILEIGDAFVFPNDNGAFYAKVNFRFVVFRPLIGEVMVGKVSCCEPNGVRVSVGFFGDILISPAFLQNPSVFIDEEQVWCWEYNHSDSVHRLHIDVGEKIYFRVVGEIFSNAVPEVTPHEAKSQTPSSVPYMIEASIDEPGLGLEKWWSGV